MFGEPVAWNGSLPNCPHCGKKVDAMTTVVDNVNQRMVFLVGCHGNSAEVIVSWPELRSNTSAGLVKLIEGRLISHFWADRTTVPEATRTKMRTVLEAAIYKTPTRKINTK